MAFSEIFSMSLNKALSSEKTQINEVSTESLEKSAKIYLPSYREEAGKYGQDPNPIGIYGMRASLRLAMYRKNIIVYSAVQTIINEICAAKWSIKPIDSDQELDEEKKKKQHEQIKKIEKFFRHPNKNRETLRFMLEKVLLDLLIHDAGVIEKVRDQAGNLVELYAAPGDTIRIKVDEHGMIKGYWQVLETGQKVPPKFFKQDDMIYMIMNPSSSSPYGFSVLNTIEDMAAGFLYGTNFNIQFFENSATPRGIIEIGPANEQQLDRFKEYWSQQNVGKPHKIMVLSNPYAAEGKGGAKWIPLAMNAKDMELKEYMNWTMKMILLAFGVTPSEVGFADDLRGAPGVGQIIQSQAFKNKTIYPMMERIASYLTNEIVHLEFKANDLEFAFIEEQSVQEELQKAQLDMILINAQIKDVDEVRKERGLKPRQQADQGGFGGFNFGNEQQNAFLTDENQDDSYENDVIIDEKDANENEVVDLAFSQLKDAIYVGLGIKKEDTTISKQIEDEYKKLKSAVDAYMSKGKKKETGKLIEETYKKLANQINMYISSKQLEDILK